jgi:hypothetical protein
MMKSLMQTLARLMGQMRRKQPRRPLEPLTVMPAWLRRVTLSEPNSIRNMP